VKFNEDTGLIANDPTVVTSSGSSKRLTVILPIKGSSCWGANIKLSFPIPTTPAHQQEILTRKAGGFKHE
jgi:hypothetical protein